MREGVKNKEGGGSTHGLLKIFLSVKISEYMETLI